MLNTFQNELSQFADEIEAEWKKTNFDSDIFPELSKSMLDRFTLTQVPEIDVILNGLTALTLPAQNFPRNEFSDFPLTLVKRKDFLLDIYIWTQSDTSIHDHNFCGAFKVIKGQSHQMKYDFRKNNELGSGFEEGTMMMLESRPLPIHSTQAIHPGSKFIHNIFHLESPTITLCVRTERSPQENISFYIFPRYRIHEDQVTLLESKWLHLLNLALQSNHVPSVVPYKEVELMNFLFKGISGKISMSIKVREFLARELQLRNPENDFLVLLDKQIEQHKKMKMLSRIAGKI